MNKIYKVIWSKVKHQYVVVSELAHSNGKQSRTSRNSIRSRIAALVVCGAIAAFGVFSALPNSAFAYPVKDPTVNEYVTADVGVAQAEKYQYVAIKTDENGETKTYTDSKHNEYSYHSETIGGTKYWVRDGYSLKIEYGNRYPDSASDKQVIAYKTTIASNADKGLLRSDQLMIEAAKNSDNQAITSFTGYVLNDVTAGTYVGATNQGGTQTPDDWNYFIQDSNGKYVDVSSYSDDSGKHPEFVEAKKQADGTYTVNGNVVSTDNLYVIGEVTETKVDGGYFNPDTIKRDVHYRLGAFVTSEGEVYTGRVFGQTNEVLMTAKDENGEYYSYWAAPTDDPNAPITNMTMGQFNTAIKEIDDNTRGLAGDDIKQIDVKSNGGNAGGTIGLLRRGNYNKDTGKWEGTEYAPGTITVTSEGGTNDSGKANDVKIKFASENGGSFTVDAGSKVEGLNSEGTATAGDTLTGIKINGEEYQLGGGKTYSPGKGIDIDENNKISVDNGAGLEFTSTNDNAELKVKANKDKGITVNNDGVAVNAGEGLAFETEGTDKGQLKVNVGKGLSINDSNQIVNNLEVTKATKNPEDLNKEHSDGGNWTITDSKADITLKNTTLVNGPVERQKMQGVDVGEEYGGNYSVKDTDGNTVTLKDVASATKLQSIDTTKIGDLKYSAVDIEDNTIKDTDTVTTAIGKLDSAVDKAATEAGKHTSVSVGDNLGINETPNGNGGTNYKVTLDDTLYLGGNHTEGDSKITLDGATGTAIIGNSTSGKATIGGVNITTTTTDGNTSSTIDGLTNNTWDNNNINQYDDSKKAATEGQLYDALTGLSKEADVAVVHANNSGNKDATGNNLKDTKAVIWNEAGNDERSSSIALGKDAFVSVQNGYKSQGILFGSDTYTGGIAIGQDSKALNGTVNIGVKDYTGKMGDVIVGDPNNRDLDNGEYNTYTAMGVGETSVGSNSYISGSLSTNIGSYNVITTKYGDYEKTGNGFMDAILAGLNKPYAAQNTGSIVVGTLNSIESNSSTDVTSGVANSVVGMANKTQNSNGSLVFGTGNEITNSIDSIPSPVELSDIISGKKNDKDVTEVANSFRDSVSDRDNKNGGAVLAIGGGNKADYALNSQLIGVQNQITGTKDAASQYNMVNGYQNTVENGSNDTVIGVKNTVTNGDSNIVLGDNHTVQNADNNVILGSSDKVATQTASDTVVIGHNAQANGNNDVAIGSGSIANGAVGTEGYAGANPIGTVSVGSEGNERTITNVAAGRINEDSTDAVNGSQLASVKDGAVKYWQNEDGSYDKSFVQLEGGEDGTLVTHVRDGAVNEYSSDAVNGSQLYAVQQEAGKHTTVTVNGGVEAPEDGSYTNKDGHLDGNLLLKQTNNDGQIQYDIKLNPDVNLTGEGKDSDNRVWLSGSNGTITATTKNNLPEKTTVINGGNVYVGTSVSVGANDDVVITDKDITGLSNTTWDGTTDDESRAATEGQLQTVSKDVASLNDGAVKYWQNEDGSYDKSFVQLEGGEDGTLVTHVRDGAVNEYSSDAVNGSQLWETQQQIEEAQTEAGKHTTIQETGKNINVTKTETDGQLDYTINLNDDITLGNYTKGTGVVVSGSSGTISATNAISVGVDPNNEQKGIVISSGKSDSIVGLDNIEWKNDADWQKDNIQADRAATEGQLQQAVSEVAEVANAGWTASDGTNSISVKPNETLTFVGNENLTVSADGTDKELKVSLNDDITLGDGENAIKIDGTNGTLNIGNTFAVAEDGTVLSDGDVIADADGEKYSLSEVGKYAVRYDKTNDGTSTITLVDGDDLSGTRIKNVADGVDPKDAVNVSQLEAVEATANAGWTASDGTNSISIKPNETLNFVGDENLTVSADGTDKKLKVSLNDNITLGDGQSAITLNGSPQNSDDPALSVGTDKFVVAQDGSLSVSDKFNVDAETGNIYAANNSGSAIMMNDDSVALNAGGNGIVASDEGILLNTNGINEDIKLVTKGTSVSVDSNGTTFTNTNTNETTNINGGTINVGDKLMVEEDGSIYATNNNGSTVMINDNGVALNSEGNGVVVSGEGITLNTNGSAVTVDRFNGTTFTNTNTNETTNINGGTINVGDKLMVEEDGSIYATNNNGSTVMINDNGVALNSEGNGVVVSGEGITLNTNGSAVTVDRFNGATFTNTNTGETTNINGDIITTDTVKGLSNTTWDDELATQVANSEELQGTAATQGQLQQAVSAVATEAAKQHTTVSGDDNLTVKSSVNENGGTNYQVTLDDDITLGNPKAGNTEGERSFTINTTAPEGYVPDSYKEEGSSGAEFIKENGGFMLFATDTQGHGIFGVTAKGSAWAKDFKTYTTDIYGNNTQYSLNDVGDAVAQMSSYYNEENGKSYTVFSRYRNEAEKDNPFETVDGATRDIPLALRDDGAVLIGATIEDDDFTDNGIRINAETETTYDGDGNEVTNNIATITGLENTEWKPPTPVATFAANDINTTSRAATEAQLDDLYSAVAAYDVNVDGTIDYSHIALAGAPYGASRAGNGTPTGGTSITNVAYASGNDGSEAVNVDYLNNAIKDAVKDGPVASNEKHLDTSKTYTPDKTTGTITINEVDGTGAVTGNQLVINDVASKAELDSLKTGVGDRNYNNVTDTTPIANGDSVTTAIGKLNNSIKGVTQDVINNSISGGHVDETGKVVLEKGEGENKSEVTTDIQLTDSEVSGVTLEKDTETGKNVLTITSTDKYDKNKTSSVTVSGLEIASTDDIKDVTGVASSEDLKDAYKDADKDGNATTEYITDSESMVEADVALDHAIQDVAGTSYANDMVLSNRIDSVEKRLGNVEERIDKVGAMAAAIANLRTMGFDPEAPTEIAIGVGQYKSETGIAIGVFHYPNQDFMLSASLSSSGDELMGGIGATWKLGRKSAAERAKDEEARHLEQAEEMKKLAQQEKVKAQAQRHAKLLAERQQASQKNA